MKDLYNNIKVSQISTPAVKIDTQGYGSLAVIFNVGAKTGTHTNGTIIGMVAVQGHAADRPVA